MTRPRVVVAGLGDSGLLTAIHLARADVDVVGVSNRPGLVSGQELGLRLARPADWQRDYRIAFDRFRRLDGVRTVHAQLTGLDTERREVHLRGTDGEERLAYDALVVATGVTNGFWRPAGLQTDADVTRALDAAHHRLAGADTVVVIGGGAAAVSTALQVAVRWPQKTVRLAFPGEGALVRHHPRTWRAACRRLERAGVLIDPGHRAVLPAGAVPDEITREPVAWSTGQPDTPADAVVWAVGRVRPNSAWLPGGMLDAHGFVRVGTSLQVPAHPEVFAVGDVAATDALRASARNRADRLVAANVVAHLGGRQLRAYRPAQRRWGSVLGPEPDGLRVFTPQGRAVRFPRRVRDHLLQPWVVERGIYGGVRRGS